MSEPILIRCEGTGSDANLLGPAGDDLLVSCAMCGATFVTAVAVAPWHQRQDILAMLDRGDFG